MVNPLGGSCKLVTKRNSGKVIHWSIRKVVHPCWTIRLVDNPQVDITTIHRKKYFKNLREIQFSYFLILLLVKYNSADVDSESGGKLPSWLGKLFQNIF